MNIFLIANFFCLLLFQVEPAVERYREDWPSFEELLPEVDNRVNYVSFFNIQKIFSLSYNKLVIRIGAVTPTRTLTQKETSLNSTLIAIFWRACKAGGPGTPPRQLILPKKACTTPTRILLLLGF